MQLPIAVNSQVLLICLNLYSALEHLRVQIGSHVLPIWIDAICINQTNNVEKASQVPMMGEIYASSMFTLSWLGPEADNSGVAVKALDHIGDASGLSRKSSSRRRYTSCAELSSVRSTP